jgi:hypothetical protein
MDRDNDSSGQGDRDEERLEGGPLTFIPGSGDAAGRPRSPDGCFEWRADLRVWAPLGEAPPGTVTPDRLFEWTGAEWRALRTTPGQTTRKRRAADWIGMVAVAVLCVLGAVAVAGAIFVYIALQGFAPSGKG